MTDTTTKHGRAKRIVRILMHIWHLVTALLILAIFILRLVLIYLQLRHTVVRIGGRDSFDRYHSYTTTTANGARPPLSRYPYTIPIRDGFEPIPDLNIVGAEPLRPLRPPTVCPPWPGPFPPQQEWGVEVAKILIRILCTCYLLPFAIYDITYTLFRLFDKERKYFRLRLQKFGIFAHLRFRAFLYQAAAAILMAQGEKTEDVSVAQVVWWFGVIMFVLGCFAKEFGFLDWVQDEDEEEEDKGKIRLRNSCDEDESAVMNHTRAEHSFDEIDSIINSS
ncbi:hypothetical protein FRC17_003011 [Serendipita sp. 399]|nr:hypothetical protein FRC17_003011 [Serendipita sp. 399]